jgi:hypothetical protein
MQGSHDSVTVPIAEATLKVLAQKVEDVPPAGVDEVPMDPREIYEAIGRTYPHLRDECRKQNK